MPQFGVLGPNLGSFCRNRVTWTTAGGESRAAGKMMPIGVDANTAVKFGVMCMDTRKVRIEMEGSVPLFIK